MTLCGTTCVSTTTDAKNCGSCGHDCTTLPNVANSAGVTCSAGKCVVPSSACRSGTGHCSANPDDGCETDFTSPMNCAGCGKQCAPGYNCSATSGCVNSCPSSTPTLCGTTCVDLNTNVNHCGMCDNAVCPNPGLGTAGCVGGVCKPTCNNGAQPCNNKCPDYSSDPQNVALKYAKTIRANE